MPALANKNVEKEKFLFLLLIGLKTGTATMEINLLFSQETRNKATSRFSSWIYM